MRYDEQFYIDRVGPLLAADYAEAVRRVGDDAQWIVWPARVQADIDGGMNADESLGKHRREWRTALGLDRPSGPTAGTAPAVRGRLRRDGRFLARDSGWYVWRGLTAF